MICVAALRQGALYGKRSQYLPVPWRRATKFGVLGGILA